MDISDIMSLLGVDNRVSVRITLTAAALIAHLLLLLCLLTTSVDAWTTQHRLQLCLKNLNPTRCPNFRINVFNTRRHAHANAPADRDTIVIPKAIVETVANHFDNEENYRSKQLLLQKWALLNEPFRKEMEGANFWTGGAFTIQRCKVSYISTETLKLQVDCDLRGKRTMREVDIALPRKATDENALKAALIELTALVGRYNESAALAKLPFGDNWVMPVDFRFNDVPHASWVRAYVNDATKSAVLDALDDPTIPNKSRMQLRINIPETNPAFDTYRIGTLLEIVRHVALELAEGQGKRVRICVQQSMGEGVFAGLPLAIAAVRAILERMDWGMFLSPEQLPPKPQKGRAASSDPTTTVDESLQLIRLGGVGADAVAADDDVFLIIAPQNMIGASVMDLLDEMAVAAAGRPMILFNPSLGDRPSSNNMMQVRGRLGRKDIADSFTDIFSLRLLYPSSGGYMFPIRGIIAKRTYSAPWLLFDREVDADGKERYELLAALPPQPTPSTELVSNIFMDAS